MTMQRIGLMQEVPNRAKREAREAGAQARVERERAMLAVVQLAVQRDAALAWLAAHYAERRVAQLAELERENRLLQDTLDARIAAGRRDAGRTHDGAPGGARAGRPPRRRAARRRQGACRVAALGRCARRRSARRRRRRRWRCRPSRCAPSLHRHAEIAPYTAMQAQAAGRGARGRCRAARRLGLGAGLQPPAAVQRHGLVPVHASTCPGSVSSASSRRCWPGRRMPNASRPSATRRCAVTARSSRPSWPNCRRSTASTRGWPAAGSRWRPNGWRWRWPATRPAAATSAPCWPRAARRWTPGCG